MSFNKHKIIFFLILTFEMVFAPILYLFEELKKAVSSKENNQEKVFRNQVTSDKLYVCIHEWAGYPLIRKKVLKNKNTFQCGLLHQLQRYKRLSANHKIHLCVTLSESQKYDPDTYSFVQASCDELIEVPNEGMDFSGYATFLKTIEWEENSYVILSNTSVDNYQTDFLKNYIAYMEANKDVGILGVSGCTMMYQSLIRNNFSPHIQSFFYLTTTDVLKKIKKMNKNCFPGDGINHKLLLIRNGEIRVSQLTLKAGYSLAFVKENGEVFKFRRGRFLDNGYRKWTLPHGDLRLRATHPNRIYPIT